MIKICYICLSDVILDDGDGNPITCDKCQQFYCEDCSYTFSLYFQYQGSMCYQCADQSRREPLNRRDYKIDYILRK